MRTEPRIPLGYLLLPIYAIVAATLLGHNGWASDTGLYFFSGRSVLDGTGVPHALGPDTLTPGLPWISQEWLFGMLVALTGIETPAFVLVKLVYVFAACAALGMYASDLERRGAGRAAIVLAVGLIASAMPIGLRTYVLTYPLAIGFASALRCRDSRRFLALPVALLWVNLHASFPLMFVICAAEIVGALVERDVARVRALTTIAFATVAIAAFANPFGFDLIRYAFRGLTPALLHAQYIDEWQPLHLFNEYPNGVDGVLVFCIAAIGSARQVVRSRVAEVLVAATTLAFAFHAQRTTAYFYLLGSPLIVVALQRQIGASQIVRRIDEFLSAGRRGMLTISCLVALCVLSGPAIGVRANAGSHDRLTVEAQPLVAALRNTTAIARPRLVCTELRQCAQAMWLGGRGIPHMLDSRTDPFPPAEWDDFMRLRSARAGWQSVLERWDLTDVLVSDEVPLFAAMRTQKTYRAIEHSADGRVIVYERLSEARGRKH